MLSWTDMAFIAAVLLIVQIVIFILFARKISADIKNCREANGIEEREAKLFRLYQSIEEMMDGFEEYVNETREDTERDRKEIQETSRQAALLLARVGERAQEAKRSEPAASAPREEPSVSGAVIRTETPAAYKVAALSGLNAKKPSEVTKPQFPRFEAVADDSVKIIRPAKPDKAMGIGNAVRPVANKGSRVEESKNQKTGKLSEADREALGRFATKTQKVRFLISKGLTVEETARELDIGKGEVQLIADLDK